MTSVHWWSQQVLGGRQWSILKTFEQKVTINTYSSKLLMGLFLWRAPLNSVRGVRLDEKPPESAPAHWSKFSPTCTVIAHAAVTSGLLERPEVSNWVGSCDFTWWLSLLWNFICRYQRWLPCLLFPGKTRNEGKRRRRKRDREKEVTWNLSRWQLVPMS